MFIYLQVYFTNALSSFANKRSKKILDIIVLGLLIFLSGTRYYMGGNDVYVYENVYNNTTTVKNILDYLITGLNNGINENYEIGFQLICAISKALQLSYWGFILVCSTLFYLLMYSGLKRYVNNWAIFISLFMYKIMFYNTFISIRQGLTLAIFCYALQFIHEKKTIKYFISCLIAFEIHRGALVLFVLYFLNYLPISKKGVKYVALAFAPTWFLREMIDLGPLLNQIIDVIGMNQKSNTWTEASEPINLLHTIECYVVIFLIVRFYDKIVKQNDIAELIIKLVLVAVPIFTLFSNWIVMTREKDYFVLLYGIVLSYGCSCDISNRTKAVLKVAVLIACLIGMIRYVLVFDNGVLMTYRSFIFEGCSIFN